MQISIPESIIFNPCADPLEIKKPNYGANEAQIRQYAAAKNLSIVFALPNQVQVDIDAKNIPSNFDWLLATVNKKYKVLGYAVTPSQSGNIHITVDFAEDVTFEQALIIEAVLGGDTKRVGLRFVEGNDSFLFAVRKVKSIYISYAA